MTRVSDASANMADNSRMVVSAIAEKVTDAACPCDPSVADLSAGTLDGDWC